MLYMGLVCSIAQPDFEYRSKLSKHRSHQMGLNQLLGEKVLQVLNVIAHCLKKYAA